MTHQYESEILNKLMERDGFNIPSSVPPYEAEIKAYLINQVKQAYPKLTDYEAEWLLYNYTKHLPADFPISSVSNVTEASFENVVPFAYQSAILKGQTLVNLANYELSTSSNELLCSQDFSLQKNNTAYTLFNFTDKTITFNIYTDSSWGGFENVGAKSKKILTLNNFTIKEVIGRASNGWDKTTETEKFLNGYIIIEGDYTNVDIPYFEGMQSVKMPVLKSTGKNLFDINHFSKLENWDGKTSTERPYCSYEMKLKPNTSYTFSRKENSTANNIYFCISKEHGIYDWFGGIIHPTDASVIHQQRTITTDSTGVLYFNLYQPHNELANLIPLLENAQLEEGSVATPYEPYKSNILTVNEDVELRGIGDVQDELDLLTGEVTERIGEIVLDDTLSYEHAWGGGYDTETDYVIGVKVNNHLWNVNNKEGGSLIKCDKLRTRGITSFNGYGYFLFYVSKSVLGEELTKAKIQEYILSLNATVHYPLATESIKTVDLTTINENGETVHFMPIEGTMNVQSSGEIIQPTFDMAVPVEATTQNLASFIDLEMEE